MLKKASPFDYFYIPIFLAKLNLAEKKEPDECEKAYTPNRLYALKLLTESNIPEIDQLMLFEIAYKIAKKNIKPELQKIIRNQNTSYKNKKAA